MNSLVQSTSTSVLIATLAEFLAGYGFQLVRLSTAALHVVSSHVWSDTPVGIVWSDTPVGIRKITMPRTSISVLFCL